jgi:hypothetical protein
VAIAVAKSPGLRTTFDGAAELWLVILTCAPDAVFPWTVGKPVILQIAELAFSKITVCTV